MKCKLIRDMTGPWTPERPDGSRPAGMIIDDPRCFRLVQMGVAIPEDDECRRKANMSEEQMLAAQKSYPKLEAGIVPEDRDAYDRGYLTGYNPDGSWIPGPNYAEYVAEESDIFLP